MDGRICIKKSWAEHGNQALKTRYGKVSAQMGSGSRCLRVNWPGGRECGQCVPGLRLNEPDHQFFGPFVYVTYLGRIWYCEQIRVTRSLRVTHYRDSFEVGSERITNGVR